MTYVPQFLALGAAANDDTGDKPRAAGTKINANLGAIASAIGALVADVSVLRSFGAKLDGVTDDLAAFQAVVSAAPSRTPAVFAVPTVVFDLQAKSALLSAPVQTGTCHAVFRGAGPGTASLIMASGGSGLIQHGTLTARAAGALHIEGLVLRDANGSGTPGAVAVSAVFSAAPQGSMSLVNMRMEKFSVPFQITDMPRNLTAENVVVFGPDFAVQSAPGFDIFTTAGARGWGSFTYQWSTVLVANYYWGWRIDGAAPTEGHRWWSCTCYNGWGMIQANIHHDALPGAAYYEAVIWYITDCDWQGYGYAIDLRGCRSVRIRNFWGTSNPPSSYSGSTIPPAPGDTTPRPRRRVMSFIESSDIQIEGCTIDYAGSQPASDSLIFVGNTCADVKIINNQINNYCSIYAGIEMEAGGNGNRIVEVGNRFTVWTGGAKVLDSSGLQVSATLLDSFYVGEVRSDNFRRRIRVHSPQVSTDSRGYIAVAFPTRTDGLPVFLAPPIVLPISFNALVPMGALSIISISTTGFVAALAGAGSGTLLDVLYEAEG